MAEADCPGTAIAVHRGAWSHLPPDLVAMVAPPISVSSLPVTWKAGPDAWRRAQRAKSRANTPAGPH
jgi:hypothetical protein